MMRSTLTLVALSLLLAAGTLSQLGCSGGSTVPRKEGDPIPTHTALISTTLGDIEIELYGKDAPKAVENFVGLADKGFYEGVLFHRVVPGFVIQAGDPQTKDPKLSGAWGTGGESIYGGTFADELNATTPSGKQGYMEGTLAMANRGPNTNTSQFFIVLSAAGASRLTYNYTIFGRVIKGMDVAHAIEKVALNSSGQPTVPITIGTIKTRKL